MNGGIVLRADIGYASKQLCRASDADAALLYLYLHISGGACTAAQASDALRLPEARVSRALDMLIAYGIAGREGEAPVKAPSSPDPAEISALREGDEAFRSLCSYLEGALGRILRRNELEALCSFYYDLSLEADLVILMINYLRRRRRLSISALQSVAYEWHDAGILTYYDGEKYLAALEEKQSRQAAVMRMLGFYDRKPSEWERRFIRQWIEWDFSDDMLKAAYERTVKATHEVSFPYMNAILKRWFDAGIKTLDAADTKDTSPAKAVSLEAQVEAMFAKKRADREALYKKRLSDLILRSSEFGENEKQLRLASSAAARASSAERERLLAKRGEYAEKRRFYLQKLGYPADYLDNKPDCPKCNDYGYIGSQMCDCFKNAVAALKKG